MKIIHIVTGLEVGGAERMLHKLLSELSDSPNIDSYVISLLEEGPLADPIKRLGISVRTVGMKRGSIRPDKIWLLYRWICKIDPDITQTWMYHGNLLGGVVARLAGCPRVVWNIRNSNLDPQAEKRTTIWTMKACAFLSKSVPDHIITCATTAGRVHAEYGYDTGRMSVIPNGFQTDHFQPDKQARISVRDNLGLEPATPVVGMVARFHPQKDHEMFIRAGRYIRDRCPNVHFVLCGTDVTSKNEKLDALIKEKQLEDDFSLLGRRTDIARLMASFDVAALSSSFGEAFPNVVGEAMACGIPCVVTDVGDAASIVGDTGRVVQPQNEKAFAEACVDLLEMSSQERNQLGAHARERVIENYSLPAVADQYKSLYESMLQ